MAPPECPLYLHLTSDIKYLCPSHDVIFQVGKEDPYSEILYDRELLLEDRVGFACRFLSDDRLLKFVGSQCSEEVSAGNLRAVVLTGGYW